MEKVNGRVNNQLIKGCITGGLALWIIGSPLAGLAQEIPDAGKTLEGLKTPVISQSPKDYKEIIIQQPQLPDQGENDTRFPVEQFRLTGEIPIPEKELQGLLQEISHKEVTVSELNKVADQISNYLHKQGYIVATAYVPEQTIQNGIVEIKIVPGKYGEIVIKDNQVISVEKVRSIVASLRTGDVIHKRELERVLLLLNDLAGLQTKAVINPGTKPGTSNLVIEINENNKSSGVIYSDNYGNKFTGANRLGLVSSWNNPFHQGDTLTFSGTTTGSNLNNYGLGYQLPLGGGWNWNINYAHTQYALGEEFSALDANGTADTIGIGLSYPLLRSYNANITGHIGYDQKKLVDDVNASNSHSSKNTHAWNMGLMGNWSEKNSAYTSYDLTYTHGRLGFDNQADRDNDAITANTQGSYEKTVLKLNRRQYINNRLSLALNVTGQYAGGNLDSSEKMSLGGANGVRAYPQGEACGDQGYLFNGELDWQLPLGNNKDQVMLAMFYDKGSITVNKSLWNGATGDNQRSLSGMGVGIMVSRAREYSLRLDYAWKLSSAVATSDTDKNGRFWLQAMKYF